MANSGVNMKEIHRLLSMQTGLLDVLSMEDAMRFVRLAASLKRHIIHWKSAYDETFPPLVLPTEINHFLGNAINLSTEFVNGCWKAFRETAWAYTSEEHNAASDAQVFNEHGRMYRLASRALYPPTTRCNNPLCISEVKILKATSTTGRKIVLYTLEDGACATYHFKLRCPTCETTYHNNYSVYKRVRTYYSGVPEAIEVGKHQFIARDVIQLFLNLMLYSWTSATNSATIYNESLAKPENQPSEWGFSFDLRMEHIWNAVSFLSILEHYESDGRILVIPHGWGQKNRLVGPIKERNRLFAEKGQPEWAHYCEKCIRFFKDESGIPKYMVRAIVSDGITIGHPCCNVAHCSEELEHKRKYFCPGHEYLQDVCSVEGCINPILADSMTCSDSDHCELWRKYQSRNGANFQLKSRLERKNLHEAPDEGVEVVELTCSQKSASGNRQLRARFGRRQTHSEQLMVRPCGIIVARATFYGSETVPQTVAMLKQVFREPGSMPEYFIYDNCCGVYNHLQATNDPLLDVVGCPVDAFHFDCKHKHCNPRKFPELVNPDGSWHFNSSKCEQTNVWLGGYHAVLREMTAYRYEFLLDELIMRKNRVLIQKLEHDGHLPSYIPDLYQCS
ncbi:hypothetical protein BJ912DRAFT_1026540 [Pholiota molesta]|nr:hypothetical protein BJ912DRAFT_1026540 [Pholiota molesta]